MISVGNLASAAAARRRWSRTGRARCCSSGRAARRSSAAATAAATRDDGVVVVRDGRHPRRPRSRRRRAADARARSCRASPCSVCADRYLAGALAERQFGATVHVLDDGFQHSQLERDVDLLLVGARTISTRPATLPSGRLREPLDTLRRGRRRRSPATTTCELLGASAVPDVHRAPRRSASRVALGATRAGRTPPTGRCSPSPASPSRERFFDGSARGRAGRRAARWRFRDHHRVLARATSRGSSARREAGGAAPSLTTEKDCVRLLPLRPFPLPVACVPLTMEPDPLPEFRRWLAGSLRRPATWLRPCADAHDIATAAVVPASPRVPRRRAACVAVVRAAADARRARRSGTLLGLRVLRARRAHRRLALREPARRRFRCAAEAERRAIARGHVRALRPAAARAAEVQHADAASRCWRASSSRARSACAPRYAQGKGVLFFTGHFGFWELHALAHALALQPMAVLARPLDNPLLHDLLEPIRGATGNSRDLPPRRGPARAARARREPGVAMLIDQHITARDAVYVDFFDRPAATTSALAALALRTGAPVVPVFALPLPGGRYRMIYEHPVEPPPADDPGRRSASSRSAAPTCSRCTCGAIPELWLWMHRRWRDAPSRRTARARDVPGGGDARSSANDADRRRRRARRARAELAGRRRDGAAGDGGRARGASATRI